MYTNQDFNHLTKGFYRPIEAAIRWCNLMKYEALILESEWQHPELITKTFPQWPCLQINTDRIFDAVRNHELPYGIFGATITPGVPVEYRLLTVRHTDLKWWMLHHYPDQRPTFLFGKLPAENVQISIGTYLTLRADRDALEVELKASDTALRELLEELKAIGLERESLRALVKAQGKLSERSETGYQYVIGALLETLLGSSPAGKPNSVFDSQAAIVDSIIAHYESTPGLSKRSLDKKFAAARRSLSRR
ncbi:hypothetical protein FBY10_11539 [Pseudomonas sp. SJZ103]|uniref:hypothetical protein n=1 Tax=unclassified Pseudomonas TaxID=196821 RepID=UPI0011A8CB38|nr:MULTISPECIES: hypothetical protein [unclassified Pseudomonas]TWC63020.1 hypothetical protein FBY10_11539 [Pseudomonas sp. SJZ103]TWC80291.1 hypothetical protein FBY08_116139 [Pseudomonas sp. SJZ094]